MVAEFLAGVIVGVLIGLAVAPLLRSWILWQTAKTLRDAAASPSSRDDASTPARIDW